MKRVGWVVWLGAALVLSSAAMYGVHYAVFRDARHIFIYMAGDLAFLPIEVLLVTLVIHRLLGRREKQALLEKLNMVIGTFFGEVGSDLLKSMIKFDKDFDGTRAELGIKPDWVARDFARARARLEGREPDIDCRKESMTSVRTFLSQRKVFLLRLLENPILLEHESFTDLLWAVFHLADELDHRESFDGLPETDYEHLSGDMKRVYTHLIDQWLLYMQHLQKSYPYLMSIEVRTNPFDPFAKVEIGST